MIVTTNYSFRERQGNSNDEKQHHSREQSFFMELTDPHVFKNRTEVSALTPLTAHLLLPIPMSSYASKAVKYDRKKSTIFYTWSKEFHTFKQKAGDNSEGLIFKYISSYCMRHYGR